MPLLEWTDALVLHQPHMDDTHREFVALIGQLEAASDHALLSVWAEFVAHTEAHFAQEDAWMEATRFAAGNCHSSQHGLVLHVLHEVSAVVAKDSRQLPMLRSVTRELAKWFVEHTGSMDTALAQHLAAVGFNPASGHMSAPERLPAEPLHGCGTDNCDDAAAATSPEATPTP
jgi:hemerythrin-like metal-binding protein